MYRAIDSFRWESCIIKRRASRACWPRRREEHCSFDTGQINIDQRQSRGKHDPTKGLIHCWANMLHCFLSNCPPVVTPWADGVSKEGVDDWMTFRDHYVWGSSLKESLVTHQESRVYMPASPSRWTNGMRSEKIMNREGPCWALISKQNSNNSGVLVILTQTCKRERESPNGKTMTSVQGCFSKATSNSIAHYDLALFESQGNQFALMILHIWEAEVDLLLSSRNINRLARRRPPIREHMNQQQHSISAIIQRLSRSS